MHDHEDASNERGVAGGAGGGSRINRSLRSAAGPARRAAVASGEVIVDG